MLGGSVPLLAEMYFTDSFGQCGADFHSLSSLSLLHVHFLGSAKESSNKEQALSM